MIALLALVPALVAAPAADGPRPSARQLAWHEVEFYGFLHFGPNTFTDAEWGDGSEAPSTFLPTDFDADQIVGTLVAGGMRGVILTAKHHDGFCLWDSSTTEHDVAASPWRDGRGDVVREIADACARRGVRFGVYVSPWDRNHAEYGRPNYVDAFRAQLRELLTGYGPIFEVWFDGANGGDGWYGGADETRTIDRGSYYDWPRTIALVRELQPGACIFSDAGPDIRWIGNERGIAGDPCWATYTPRAREGESAPGPGTTRWQDGFQGHRDGEAWMPGEVDVSIRPGWFFHARENERVRSVDDLLDLYYGAVGQGASLLLNVPPDRRGRIHETDAAHLAELGAVLDATFGRDLADGAPRRFDEVAGAAATFTLELPARVAFDVVSLRERIADGQRIDGWSLEARTDGRWRTLAEGRAIGARRLWRGELVVADAVRLRIESCSAPPRLSEFSLHRRPPVVRIVAEAVDFLDRTTVRFACDDPSAVVRHTVDGSDPVASSPAGAEVEIDRSAVVRARAFVDGEPSCRTSSLRVRRWSDDDLRRPIVFVRAPDPGLRWRAWSGGRRSTHPAPERSPDAEGVSPTLRVLPELPPEHVLVHYDGVLSVPTDGIYRFSLASDDGSRLLLHGEPLVDNDGLHGTVVRDGAIGLAAGFHPIRVEWFNATGAAALRLEWTGPGVSGEVPAGALAH